MKRYQTYRKLMTDRRHWQKTFAVISCKIIREKHELKGEFNVLLNNLGDPALRRLVQQRDWRLVFTGGTFHSLPANVTNCPELKGRLFELAPSAAGVIQIANLVVYGQLFGIAFFNHMEDLYADSPQNLCLRRICNHYGTPLFEDASSIQFILDRWKGGLPAPRTRDRFPTREVAAYYGSGRTEDEVLYRQDLTHGSRRDRSRETIAIVSHDEQKVRMLNFCLEHISRILSFRRVVSTGTTGSFLAEQYRIALEAFGTRLPQKEVQRWGWDRSREDAKAFLARKIQPMASGPKGGDVQISAKIIDGTCHRVLFFQDPGSAHPHQFDIRLMEKAVQDPETAALFASSARTARAFV